MQKITLLSLQNQSESDELMINVSPIFRLMDVEEKAFAVITKYESSLIDLSNELMDVLKEASVSSATKVSGYVD